PALWRRRLLRPRRGAHPPAAGRAGRALHLPVRHPGAAARDRCGRPAGADDGGRLIVAAALTAAAVWASMSVVMAAAWLHQRRIRNAGVVDIYWTFGTGVAGVCVALAPIGGEALAPRQWLAAALIAAWSARLGGYILVRTMGARREDARYKRLREEWGARFGHRLLWFLQIQAPITA